MYAKDHFERGLPLLKRAGYGEYSLAGKIQKQVTLLRADIMGLQTGSVPFITAIVSDIQTISDLPNPNIQKTFWTYQIDGKEIYDAEFKSRQDALQTAQDNYFESFESGERGDHSEPVDLIRFEYDDKGEMIILDRIKDVVEYEYYQGDKKEHGTW